MRKHPWWRGIRTWTNAVWSGPLLSKRPTFEMVARSRHPSAVPLALAACAVLAAACSTSPRPSATSRTTKTTAVPGTTVPATSPPTTAPPPFYKVTTGSVAGLGTVLVNGEGFTLYMFEPDKQSGSSTCHGECENVWPPVLLVDGVKARWPGLA
jgi:hypothetical protein